MASSEDHGLPTVAADAAAADSMVIRCGRAYQRIHGAPHQFDAHGRTVVDDRRAQMCEASKIVAMQAKCSANSRTTKAMRSELLGTVAAALIVAISSVMRLCLERGLQSLKTVDVELIWADILICERAVGRASSSKRRRRGPVV